MYIYTYIYIYIYMFIRKSIFACLFSIHNIIILSRLKQVCLSVLHFER